MDIFIITALSLLNCFVVYRFIAPCYGMNEAWGQVAVYDNTRAMFAFIFFAGTASLLMFVYPRREFTLAVIAAGAVLDGVMWLLPLVLRRRE